MNEKMDRLFSFWMFVLVVLLMVALTITTCEIQERDEIIERLGAAADEERGRSARLCDLPPVRVRERDLFERCYRDDAPSICRRCEWNRVGRSGDWILAGPR